MSSPVDFLPEADWQYILKERLLDEIEDICITLDDGTIIFDSPFESEEEFRAYANKPDTPSWIASCTDLVDFQVFIMRLNSLSLSLEDTNQWAAFWEGYRKK